MIWKIMYWLVAIALFVVLAVDHAQAAVIISEVAPAPITGPEWVELYNTGPEMINFNSWYLEDKLASPARIYDFVFDSTIPNKWQFPPYTFLVVSLSSAKLNNSGDGVTLYNPDHQMSATMNYANTNAGKTWGLQALDFTKYIESDPNPNQFTPTPPSSSPSPLPSSSPSPTPTIPFPSPSPSSNTLDTALVSLHTYHPCPPSGEKEWLSLLYSGQKIHTFENWVIADESGNTRTLSGTLVPKETTKLEWSGALLNNTGDSFTLHSDDSKLITSASFTNCTGEILVGGNPTPIASSSATILDAGPQAGGQSTGTSQSDSQSTTKTTQKSDYLKLISQLTPPGPSSYDLTQNDLITSYEKVWVKREPSLIAVQSVIIGGTFLMASAALLLHHPQKSKNNSLPALYVETLS